MTSTNLGLAALLVAQIALAAYTWMPTETVVVKPVRVFDFGPEDVQKMSIYGPVSLGQAPATAAVLERTEEGWVLPTRLNYPADPGKVEPIVDQIANIKIGEQIASQEHHHAALHVATDDYTRRVQIELKDGRTEDIYLGAGITFRDNLRRASEANTYTYKTPSVWEIPDTNNRYFERDVLAAKVTKVPTATIQHAAADMTFFQANGRWSLQGAPEGYRLDQQKIFSELTGALTFRMLRPIATQVEPEHGFDNPTARVTWTEETDQGTKRFSYLIGACSGLCYGKVDGEPWVYEVRQALVRQVQLMRPDSVEVRQTMQLRPKPKGPKKSHGRSLQDL